MAYRRSSLRMRVAVAATGGLLLAGCAQFDDSAADGEWRSAPELTPQKGPQPELPEAPGGETGPGAGPGGPGGPSGEQQPVRPPKGCKDYDPFVIGTCLDTVVAVAALSANRPYSALAAESSGKVFKVVEGKKPAKFASLKVGGGELTGLALSPSYAEDGLVFAYITTASDNRVVRFSRGKAAKPVLTGIPKGSGNRGVLAVDNSGALLVATGDGGDAKAAADPKSLAGKVLRIDTSGQPADGNPKSRSRVVASGLHSPGGICSAFDGSRAWVTDRAGSAETLHLIKAGQPLGTPIWSWKDKPGVAGCADNPDGVGVAMSTAANIQFLEVEEDGSVTGKPRVAYEKKDGYGRVGGMDLAGASVAIAGTVNKDGGDPVSSDDRVFLLRAPVAGGGKD